MRYEHVLIASRDAELAFSYTREREAIHLESRANNVLLECDIQIGVAVKAVLADFGSAVHLRV